MQLGQNYMQVTVQERVAALSGEDPVIHLLLWRNINTAQVQLARSLVSRQSLSDEDGSCSVWRTMMVGEFYYRAGGSILQVQDLVD